jgi:hypothetical protein
VRRGLFKSVNDAYGHEGGTICASGGGGRSRSRSGPGTWYAVGRGGVPDPFAGHGPGGGRIAAEKLRLNFEIAVPAGQRRTAFPGPSASAWPHAGTAGTWRRCATGRRGDVRSKNLGRKRVAVKEAALGLSSAERGMVGGPGSGPTATPAAARSARASRPRGFSVTPRPAQTTIPIPATRPGGSRLVFRISHRRKTGRTAMLRASSGFFARPSADTGGILSTSPSFWASE